MMGYGWGMGAAGLILMALLWVAVIGLIAWLVGALLPGARPGWRDRSERPEDILDRRFALGELDVEQYQRARQNLAAVRDRR